MIDVTNGELKIQQTDSGSVIISSIYECLGGVPVSVADVPWLINTLGDIHRELIADANRAQDAAALVQWDADVLASMMAG